MPLHMKIRAEVRNPHNGSVERITISTAMIGPIEQSIVDSLSRQLEMSAQEMKREPIGFLGNVDLEFSSTIRYEKKS